MDQPTSAHSSDRYAKQFLAGWGTMDFNGHLANRAYLDLAADVRMSFFAEHGFPPVEFRRLAIGPVVKKDELEYYREIGLHETVTVTLAALGPSPDGARFVLKNEVWSERNERAARVRSTGGWLDLRARKLVAPPAELLHAMRNGRGAPSSGSCRPSEPEYNFSPAATRTMKQSRCMDRMESVACHGSSEG